MKANGECIFCRKTFYGNVMEKHLQSCSERMKANRMDKEAGKVFLIKARAGPYWVYFEVDGSAPLKKVDGFLRDLWLECCGHLSAFTIGAGDYVSHPQRGESGMDAPLESLLAPGVEFRHEYDFGSTTRLALACVSERKGGMKGKLRVLARNNPPNFRCSMCGKPASVLCAQCMENAEDFFLCGSCGKKHGCGEDMFMRVVNSPRMGVCGYTGD